MKCDICSAVINNQKDGRGDAGLFCAESHHHCLTTPPSTLLLLIYSTTESHKRQYLFLCMSLTLLQCATIPLSPCIRVCERVSVCPLQLVCMTNWVLLRCIGWHSCYHTKASNCVSHSDIDPGWDFQKCASNIQQYTHHTTHLPRLHQISGVFVPARVWCVSRYTL